MTDLLEVAKIPAAYLIGCFILHGLVHVLNTIFIPEAYKGFSPSEKQLSKVEPGERDKFKAQHLFRAQINFTMTGTSMLYSACLFAFNLHVMYTFYNTEGMYTGTSFYSTHSIALHLATCVYESCTYVATGKGFVFYLHHLVVAGNAMPVLLTGRMHPYYCWVGLVEGTNVPLCLLTMFGQFPSMKGGAAHTASGAALWISYVFIRVLLPGHCMYSMFAALQSTPEKVFVFENETWNNAWIGYFFVTGIFLWMLSMYWFYLITKGLLKAILPKAKEKTHTS